MTIAKWWYRVSGQQQRDEVAAIRSMAYRFGQTAATLLPEINALTALVGIERLPDPDRAGRATADREHAGCALTLLVVGDGLLAVDDLLPGRGIQLPLLKLMHDLLHLVSDHMSSLKRVENFLDFIPGGS